MSLILSAGFLLVAGALGYWQVIGANRVLDRPTNPRTVEEERRILRGRILDRNGEVLASSERAGELAHRAYAYPPLADVVGYWSIQHGKSGIEEAFDSFLRGERSTNPAAEIRNKLFPVDRHGADVRLTLDLQLQKVADDALGGSPGAAAVVDVSTGEVLALASHPYFDPNTLDEDWERLANDRGEPFVSRAINGQYVPGSIFKLVTASAALDSGIATAGMEHHHEADLIVDGLRIRNTNHPQLTDLTFAEEFAWSCNVFFAYTGLSLGGSSLIDYSPLASREPYTWPAGPVDASEARLREYARRYGIGQAVPFDLPTSAGLISKADHMTRAQLASTAFGQGDLLVSPLQMALVAATVDNGGVMPAPYIVASVEDGKTVERIHQPGAGGHRVISESAAAELNAMMELSVDTAYAQPARIPGVRVGGKTGTAEVSTSETPHSWFVGYAPADRPGVAVAVIMENRGSGTTFATPAARKILKAALDMGY